MSDQRRMLTDADREEISRGIAENLEGKVIATHNSSGTSRRDNSSTTISDHERKPSMIQADMF